MYRNTTTERKQTIKRKESLAGAIDVRSAKYV
jgi:hypothetical protein